MRLNPFFFIVQNEKHLFDSASKSISLINIIIRMIIKKSIWNRWNDEEYTDNITTKFKIQNVQIHSRSSFWGIERFIRIYSCPLEFNSVDIGWWRFISWRDTAVSNSPSLFSSWSVSLSSSSLAILKLF